MRDAGSWGGVDVGGVRSAGAEWTRIEDAISDAEENSAVLFDTKFDARRAIIRTKRGYYADIPYTSDQYGLDVVGTYDERGFTSLED